MSQRRRLRPLSAPRLAAAACGAALAAAGFALPACAAPAPDLTALGLEQLLEIPVVGASKYEQRQADAPAAVTVITRQEIRAFGWRTLADALASLPGVHLTYDRQYTYLGTRGFGVPGDLNVRLLLTIDGNRVNDPLYDGAPLGRELPLDLDLVERIEFIPGPGSAVYGQNAMFGVVNVVTRRGTDVGGTELAARWEPSTRLREGRATWGRRLDNGVDVLLSASGLRDAGADRFYDYGAAGVSGVAAGLDGERDRDLQARVTAEGWHVELTHGRRRKDDPTGSFLSDPLVAGQYAADRYDLGQIGWGHRVEGRALDISARVWAGRYRFASVLSYGTPLSTPGLADWRGAEARVVSGAVAGHKLMLGIEAQWNVRTDQAALDLAVPANDVRIPGSAHRVGVYAQDEWQVGDALTATLGLRLDRNDLGEHRASPRVGLIWRADGATTLKALYGRAHRAPNVYESRYDDGVSLVANPGLRSERVDTVELVGDRRVGHELALRASVYEWTMHHLVTLGVDPSSGLSQYRSGGTVRARGVELSADRTWASGARARGSVSHQDVSDAAGARLSNSPRWLGRLLVTAPLPAAGWRLGYELRVDGARRTLAGAEAGGHALSHVHLSTTALAPGVELSVGVRNLFDKRHAHPGADTNWQDALEQDGRSLRVALACRF